MVVKIGASHSQKRQQDYQRLRHQKRLLDQVHRNISLSSLQCSTFRLVSASFISPIKLERNAWEEGEEVEREGLSQRMR